MVEPGASQPRVSVIIPAYNAAAHLAETVASAQAQSVADLEILVVDDASEDTTLAVARDLASRDPRVRVLPAGHNLGPSGARNLGLAAARGTWVALLDADDAFLPERLSRLLEAAEEGGVEVVADNLLLEDEDDSAVPMLPPENMPTSIAVSAADFLLGNLPDPEIPRRSYGFLKPIIKRDFLERVGLRYDEELRFAEDFAFYLGCFAAGARFRLVREPLYRYRVRGDSLTARHSTEDLRRLQHLDARLLDAERFKAPDCAAALRRHKRSIDQRLQWRVVIDAVKAGAWGAALRASLTGWHVFGYVAGKLAGEAWRRGCKSARAAET